MRISITVWRWIGLAVALALAPAAGVRAQSADTVRIAVNPQLDTNLPIFLAIDRGYFAKQNLNVVVTKIPGSSAVVAPMLALGDIDIAPLATAPSFFNQFDAGFDAKIIAGASGAHPGWSSTVWLLVRQDEWDNGTIRKLSDLRGKSIDAANAGTPISLVVLSALQRAHLAPSDVRLTMKLKNTADWYSAMINKAFDVIGANEPAVGQLEDQKLGHKWMSMSELVPWYQPTYLVASSSFAHDHRAVAVRFLVAYLQATRDVLNAHGTFTPDLLKELSTWSGISETVLARQGGPSYPGNMGAIDAASLRRIQEFWLAQGLAQRSHPVENMIDASLLPQALKQLGGH
ncbi:MAG: ABC transporter substrate-binding protein [Candidatus Lustribacter sp.]